MGVKLGYKDLVTYLSKDEEQLKMLSIISKNRGISLKSLVRRGIFGVPDRDELGYLLEQWDMDFEDAFGLDLTQVSAVTDGFIIPVLDSSYKIRYFINYNWDREKGKYRNVYPGRYKSLEGNYRLFGMHNLGKGIREGWIVVVEGVFDAIRLESCGVPTIALTGTRVGTFQKNFLGRFNKVIYVSDNDWEGLRAWDNVKRDLDNAIHYPISGVSKDVDEFAVEESSTFRQWLRGLKLYKG